MTSTVRAMPRVVFPGPGESFPSWMMRLAVRVDLDPSTLQTRVGLVDERRGTLEAPVGYGTILTDRQRSNLAAATRTSPETVDASLLAWFNGGPISLTGLDPDDPTSLRRVALYQWAYFSSSHTCSDCLQENGWQWSLTWRLPWHYACTTHRRYLASNCPRCDQPFMLARRDRIFGPPLASRVPTLNECNNPLPTGIAVRGRTPVPCGHPLDDIATPVIGSGSLLNAQQTLHGHMTRRDRPSQWWTDLRAIASLLMRFSTPEQVSAQLPGIPQQVMTAVERHCVTVSDHNLARGALVDGKRGPRSRTHTDTPADPVLFSPYATIALATVTAVERGTGEATGVLRSLYEASRAQTATNLAGLLRERDASVPLVAAGAAISTRNTILTRRPQLASTTRAGDGTGALLQPILPSNVPWLWWPDRYDDILNLLPTDLTPDFGRAYLSLAATKALTHATWIECAEAIGWSEPRKARHTASSVISRLRSLGTVDTVNDHVLDVIDELGQTSQRIDYRARRTQLASLTTITPDQWNALAATAEVDLQPTTWRLRGVAAWLWHHHGLNPTSAYPGFTAHGDRELAVEMFRRFRREELPRIEIALHANVSALVTDAA